MGAEKKDLEPLLNPESIAIIGASEKPYYAGRLLKNLIDSGYTGKIYPVNFKYREVFGLRCYQSVLEIPDEVDMLVYAIGRNYIFDVLAQCSKKGVKSVVIITAGFSESDEQGKNMQMKINEFAKNTGIRICGPNCYGLANFVGNIIATPERDILQRLPSRGKIGLVSQSGALGFCSMFHHGRDREISFSYVISSGNEVDLEVADYINYLIEDPNTNAIAVFIEGLKNTSKFLEVCDVALEKGKPIIALKVGRSALGRKSAISHTGSMAGSDLAYTAVFKQKGVIRVYDQDELILTSNILSSYRLPKGDGVAIVSTSGGFATFLADSCEELGICLPDISGNTLQRLLNIKELLTFGKLANPTDIRGQGFLVLEKVLRPLIEDEKYDVIILAMVTALPNVVKDIIEVTRVTDKPIFVIWLGRRSPRTGEDLEVQGYKILEKSGIPVFYDPVKCLRTIKNYFDYAALRKRSKVLEKPVKKMSFKRLRRIKNRLKSRREVLNYNEGVCLLSEYGIPVARGEMVVTPEEGIEAAKRIGYPVAIKIVSPQFSHKTDIKAIKLNIRSPSELVEGFERIIENAKKHSSQAQVHGVLVQEMVKDGIETIVGVSRDVQFGPLILFGLGGVFVEILKDYSVRLPPLSKEEAFRMVREIEGFEVLNGFRGKPKADINSIIDVLIKVSDLALNHKEYISEIDINPLIVQAEGEGAKAVDVLVAFR